MTIGIRTAGVIIAICAALICYTADPHEQPDGSYRKEVTP